MPHLILYWMGTRDYQIFTQHLFYRGGGERRLLDHSLLTLPSVVCTSHWGCLTKCNVSPVILQSMAVVNYCIRILILQVV